MLDNIAQELENERFIKPFKEEEQYFTRNRKLSFKDTVMFPCYFSQSNLQSELNTYFSKFSNEEIYSQHVDKSAYSHARRKYKFEVYQKMNNIFIDGYYDIPEVNRTFYGFNVYGVDGTLIPLPDEEEIAEKFGIWEAKNGDSSPRGRVSAFYDCVNEISLESYIVPKSTGERELAKLHILLRNFYENDITVYDRGYASKCLQKRHLEMGLHFCMRMPTTWKIVKDLISDEDSEDKIVTVEFDHISRKECIEEGLEPVPYKIRLVKIKLDSGETEVLATSLFSENLKIEFFYDLYHLRWSTEENYKSIKCKVKMGKFIGRTVKAIYQEFYARMFMINVTSAIKNIAQMEVTQEKEKSLTVKKTKYEYKINFKSALSKIRKFGSKLFIGIISRLKRIIFIFKEDLTPIRPNRKFVRNKKNVKAFYQTYSDI